jgi:hypothetical protein
MYTAWRKDWLVRARLILSGLEDWRNEDSTTDTTLLVGISMDTLIYVLRYVTIDILDSRFLFHILLASVLTFFFSKFVIGTIPGFAERVGPIFAPQEPEREGAPAKKKGPYQQYLSLLQYFLDSFAVVFYSQTTGRAKLRPLIQIYSTFLALALAYTVVLFFIGWATGGSGEIGQFRVIVPDYGLVTRLAIAVGWGFLGYLVWTSVRDHERFNQVTANKLAALGIRLRPELAFALAGGAMVFLSQWISQDRTFTLSPAAILITQIALALAAFIAIYWNKRSAVGFTHVATACYGLSIGVPILIGVPIAVAIVTAIAGKGPLLVSTTVVPLLMLLYYYVVPGWFQETEFSNLVLAAIGCFPLLLAVFAVSLRDTSLARAIVYSIISFLPFWIPVSFSSYQISHPVAFAVVVFWFLVPVINGVWDSISWWLTWRLLNHLRAALDRIEELEGATLLSLSRWKSIGQRFAILTSHIVVNFVISSCLFMLTFFVVLAALALGNELVRSSRPEYMVNVEKLLSAVKNDPYAGDGLWMMTMVFVTLIPALFHLFFVLLATFLSGISPRLVARSWGVLSKGPKKITQDEAKRATNTVAIYLALSVLFISTFFLGVWNLYWRFGSDLRLADVLAWVGEGAINAAKALQNLIY